MLCRFIARAFDLLRTVMRMGIPASQQANELLTWNFQLTTSEAVSRVLLLQRSLALGVAIGACSPWRALLACLALAWLLLGIGQQVSFVFRVPGSLGLHVSTWTLPRCGLCLSCRLGMCKCSAILGYILDHYWSLLWLLTCRHHCRVLMLGRTYKTL